MYRNVARSPGILTAIAALALTAGCASQGQKSSTAAAAPEESDIETRLNSIEAAAMEAQRTAEAARLAAEENERRIDRAFERSQQK